MKQNYVYCIIPTFNRLKELSNCIQQLKKQTYKNIKIIIINDGSSDGKLNYLEGIDDDNFHFITGDGDLWWGKSINEGFKFVLDKATSQDFILLLNDDTYFDENCVQYFLDDHRDLDRKIILGAYQADIDTKEKTALGYKINYFKTRITENFSWMGVILWMPFQEEAYFFIKTLEHIGIINTYFFRQAMGDLEFTSRAKEKA